MLLSFNFVYTVEVTLTPYLVYSVYLEQATLLLMHCRDKSYSVSYCVNALALHELLCSILCCMISLRYCACIALDIIYLLITFKLAYLLFEYLLSMLCYT
jgi:hypothetical protein